MHHGIPESRILGLALASLALPSSRRQLLQSLVCSLTVKLGIRWEHETKGHSMHTVFRIMHRACISVSSFWFWTACKGAFGAGLRAIVIVLAAGTIVTIVLLLLHASMPW